MKGIYICKTYRKLNNNLVIYLKYGKTNNIKTRIKYYNKKATYKLLAFFPVKDYLDERERLIQNKYIEYRFFKTEHIEYEKGSFKVLYNQVKDAVENTKIIKTKKGLNYIDATL